MAKEQPSTAENTAAESKWREELINDYRLACISREASLLGRREVLTGKAKFGIFGDGKEVAQIAMAKQFKDGDFRSGYYRDQTFMMAIDLLTVEQYFSALYAQTDVHSEPSSAGRQMGGHYSTRNLNEDGTWMNLAKKKNSSADISPTAGQMPRLLGLAQASKVYRENEDLHDFSQFSDKGNEVAFGTIGDASTSEGLFWETVNAATVMQVPMALSIWDDGYGISVPKKYQTAKESISQALSGFDTGDGKPGMKIFKVKGWDYPSLISTYDEAIAFCRENHAPVMIHVEELTQPQGHSTSGSHERYKSKEVLEWTKEYDCNAQFRKFILLEGAASEEELSDIEDEAKKFVRQEQKRAWNQFITPIQKESSEVVDLLQEIAAKSDNGPFVDKIATELKSAMDPIRKDVFNAARKTLRLIRNEDFAERDLLIEWLKKHQKENRRRYSSHLYSESNQKVLNIAPVAPTYDDDAEMVDGRIILKNNFEKIFEKYPQVLTFGEDTGKIGGVNQSMEGMQEKFGELRVSDTGIREATILGQGIGMAMRGLRPIAEIQYLDYLYYALQIMRDDLASVQYRTRGGQKAPLIVRTRGHRLEGIWHSGSPMGAIINSLRGMHICVPRNMVQAAGMYNTLLESDEPALIIECLNGYRSKEALPNNIGEFKTPIGRPEVVREGTDITLVSYGSTFNLCVEAAKQLQETGISAELIDVQTLLPFDINHDIKKSLEKTNRIIFIDEDVPGGASAFMLDEVINRQKGYFLLDSEPRTLSAQPHLPAYGTDGDYFSKPSIDDIFEAVYNMMHEADPETYPSLYQ